MTKFPLKAAGVLVLLLGVSIFCLGWIFPGRMTGGGSVLVQLDTVTINGGVDPLTKVTHGFEIHCGSEPNGNGVQVIPTPNNLEVNWPNANNFHMDTLTLAHCECNTSILPPQQPSSGFNEFIGKGTGKLNGQPGASITFDFTDQGEPGKAADTVALLIKDPAGTTVLSFGNYLGPAFPGDGSPTDSGNQQAHNGPGVCHGSK